MSCTFNPGLTGAKALPVTMPYGLSPGKIWGSLPQQGPRAWNNLPLLLGEPSVPQHLLGEMKGDIQPTPGCMVFSMPCSLQGPVLFACERTLG